MALRAVMDHPKLARLKVLLRMNKSCTLGYLEAMWQFCGRYTPAGNIGKYSNEEIEAWLEWDGDEGGLVRAFVRAGWIDEHEGHRLIVHDWGQHADDMVHTELARKCIAFADGLLPRTRRLNQSERNRFRAVFPEVDNSHDADSLQECADIPLQIAAAVTKPEPEPEPEPEASTPPPTPPTGGREFLSAVDRDRRTRRPRAPAKASPASVGVYLGPTAPEIPLDEVNAMRQRHGLVALPRAAP